MTFPPPHEVKLVLLGPAGVGKSAVSVQFVQQMYLEDYDDYDIYEDDWRKQLWVDGELFQVEIADTKCLDAAQSPATHDQYLRNGQGFLIIFSITAQSTFDDLEDIVESVLRVKDMGGKTTEVPLVFCGNKVDLEEERMVETHVAQEFAERYGAAYIETSAKTRTRIEEAFAELIRRVHAQNSPKKTKAEVKAEAKRLRQQHEVAKRARKTQKAAQRAVERQANIDAATPKEIPDTALPTLPAPAMPGEMRRLHERALSGGNEGVKTCDIEFVFPPQGADDAAETKLRAHKVVVLGKAGALLRDSDDDSAKPCVRGVTRVHMKQDGISLAAFRHLLSFVYSGQLDSRGADHDEHDDQDDSVNSAPSFLWGPWQSFASELETAADDFDMPRLRVMVERGGDVNSDSLFDGACSLGVMLGAEFLADVEFAFDRSGRSDDNGYSRPVTTLVAHQAVLRARSPYFERMFSLKQFAEGAQAANNPGEERIKIPMDANDCCEGALRRGLAFLYEENDASLENDLVLLATGQRGNDDPSVIVMDLWRLARRWEVERLILVVERVLVRSLTAESVCFFVQESLPSDASTGRPGLLAACMDFASYRLESVSQVESFAELDADVRERIQASHKPGLWADPEAPGKQKLKKRLGLWKASLIS
jgi:Ras-related protein Rap-1A